MRLASFALCAAALAGSAAADTPAPGFQVAALAASPDVNPNPFGFGFDVHGVGIELSNGDLVGFDGTDITRRSADGTTTTVYHTLPQPVFPSLVVVDPTETFFVVGESSFGDLYRVELGTQAVGILANVPFNYDAAFDSSGALYVSHGASVTGFGTTVSRIDASNGDAELVAQVPGPSGPIEFDAGGNLYYGLIDQMFKPGACRVVRWSATQLESGVPLTEHDGARISTGWDNIAFFAYDSEVDRLFIVENGGNGPPEIYRASTTRSTSQLVAVGPPGTFISNPRVDATPGPAIFAAFQPAEGGTLRYSLSNFPARTLQRFEARPLRPITFVEGPGVTGPGAVTLGVSGARPGGTVVFWFTSSSFVEAVETVYLLPDLPPLFWSFGNAFSKGFPFFFPVGDDGRAQFSFFNPGGFEGNFGFHGMLTDTAPTDPNVKVEGTATVVIF